MSSVWNPWHGCHKISEGCRRCYIYRGDARRGVDTTQVTRTKNFDLPVRRKRNGEYKIPSGTEIATCFSSDFFVEDADSWRMEAWQMIRERSDLHFLMITKRIDRFCVNLPTDWGDGYENATICCTVENQKRADERLPIFRELPIKRKMIVCTPLLEPIDLEPYLGPWTKQVVAGGESGPEATTCHFEWILSLRESCIRHRVSFWFKQTGSRLMKDGQLYKINYFQEHTQARKAGVNINAVKM